DLAQFGDAVDAARDIFAEIGPNLFDGGAGVLYDVVQQPGFERHQVHLHVGKLERNLQWMHDIRIAGTALLVPMALSRELEGLAQRRQVLAWTAGANAVFKLLIKLLDWSRRGLYDGGHPGLRTPVGF